MGKRPAENHLDQNDLLNDSDDQDKNKHDEDDDHQTPE